MVTVNQKLDENEDTDIPSLADLEAKLKQMDANEPLETILSLRKYFGDIASGESPPILMNHPAQFAAQALCVVINHFWGSWKEQVERHEQAS